MKILVTGNQGYIGSELGKHIKAAFPECQLCGLDTGFFSDLYSLTGVNPDIYYDVQIRKDVRAVIKEDLQGVDCIIHLAAISNDPMGSEFKDLTEQINILASHNLLRLAEDAGVKKFIFASSCSVYGSGGKTSKTEEDTVAPLTDYAKSKISFENILQNLNSDRLVSYAFRFATACGSSARVRLDLVLNNFIASALTNKVVAVLSDGSPLRPLIDVEDMCASFIAAIKDNKCFGHNVFNVGRNNWNFTVKSIADAVANSELKCEVAINPEASPDKRSYAVNFDKFNTYFPGAFDCDRTFAQTISETTKCILRIPNLSPNFQSENFIRLNHLRDIKKKNFVDDQLEWLL